MNKELKEAIEKTINKNYMVGVKNRPTTNYSDGREGWNLETLNYPAQRNYITMLNHLPNLMNDTEKVETLVRNLVLIVAQQQQEILDLRNLVNCALLDKTRVVIEKNFNEHFENIIKDKNVKEVENLEFDSSIEITTENQSTEDYQFDENSKQFNSQSQKISGGLTGLLSILASLEMSKEDENTNLNETITKIDEKITNSKKINYKGTVTSKYGKVKKSGWLG